MSEGWKKTTLGEMLETIRNGVNCKQNKDCIGDKISRIESIATGEFDYSRVGYSELSAKDKTKFILEDGDILFSHINSVPHVGKTAQFKAQDTVYHGVNLLLMRPVKTVRADFLERYLSWIYGCGYWRNVCKQSINQASVNQQDIKKVQVAFPVSLSEQKRIVAILDEAFGAIARAKENAARNLANARELFDSYLNRMFTEKGDGWEEKKLSEVATTFGRGKSRHRPRNDKSLYGGEYPFIQTGEIRNSNHYITEFTKTYNEKGLAQSKLWPVGTLCITIAANIAETAILTFDACIPDSVIGLVCDPEKANVDFVEYLLQYFKSGLQAEGKGSAQDNINMGTFERMLFPFPSVSEQEKIVCELNAIAESCNTLSPIYQQKLTVLDELKQSLLQKAFTGQLTSQSKELELVP